MAAQPGSLAGSVRLFDGWVGGTRGWQVFQLRSARADGPTVALEFEDGAWLLVENGTGLWNWFSGFSLRAATAAELVPVRGRPLRVEAPAGWPAALNFAVELGS